VGQPAEEIPAKARGASASADGGPQITKMP